MSTNRDYTLRQDQAGLVSIMVTMIMMLVISLIVLGFAQVTRHNQRQSLNSQLSSQAYYAAESGVNDAVAKLKNPTGPFTPADQTDCKHFISAQTLTNVLDTSTNVAYTCLLVDNTPPSLQYAKISNGQAIAIPLTVSAPLTTLTISWKAADTTRLNPANCSSNTDLPQNATTSTPPAPSVWACSYGLLRLDLTNKVNPTDPADAANNTLTYYFKPSATTNAVPAITDFTATTKGNLINLNASACVAGTCTVNLPLSGATASGLQYYARISAVYRDLANITIKGKSNATDVTFQGSQAVIDATGKAQDVLRRIQVHVPLISDTSQASAAIQASGSICKLVTVQATSADATCPSGGPIHGGTP